MASIESVRRIIRIIAESHGGYRKAAGSLGLANHTLLYRVATGEKMPNDEILDALGFERVVTYRLKAGGPRRK